MHEERGRARCAAATHRDITADYLREMFNPFALGTRRFALKGTRVTNFGDALRRAPSLGERNNGAISRL